MHDDLAGDGTSRLSPYLRFGCVSPLEVANAALDAAPAPRRSSGSSAGATSTTRWRAAFPKISRRRTTAPAPTTQWRPTRTRFRPGRTGETGVPIVDAGMRQLRGRGLDAQPGPADRRLVPDQAPRASTGGSGSRWFFRWLLDGDVANNSGNWQWVAGTGNDTRPYRRFNPIRQAERYDPDGAYIARYPS